MKMRQQAVEVAPRGRGLHDVTAEVRRAVASSGVQTGMCNIFLRHTSASLLIQENADGAVLRDLQRFFDRLAPESADYEHDAEGPDDMPSHLRAAMTRTAETVPISGGELALGTWQAIYLWEHRRAPHQRVLVVTVWGE
ncbi:MAG TPA: secondary thiamine-phosphate synthase enzyme YjbQ [Myxococcales bacterium]